MFYKIKRFFLEASRPPAWRKAAADWRKAHPFCAVCGLKKTLEVHDVTPYHLIENPKNKSYEFWMHNFITLCHHDHHRLAHCGDPTWRSYNPVIWDLAYRVRTYLSFCERFVKNE